MYTVHNSQNRSEAKENTWSCIYTIYIMTLSTLFSICFFSSGVRKSSNWICFLGFTSWAAFLYIKFVETWKISRTDMEIFNFDVQNAENHSEWTSKNLNLVCLDLRVFVEFVEGAVAVPLEPGAVALLPARHLRRDVLRQPGPVGRLARPAAGTLALSTIANHMVVFSFHFQFGGCSFRLNGR